MNKYIKISLFFIGTALLTSCSVFMKTARVHNILSTYTKSRFIYESQVENLKASHKGFLLVKGRKYIAPVGMTAKDDLKNAAKGIDKWVALDGGNAYVLKDYRWV